MSNAGFPPMPAPALYALAAGRFEGKCGRCLHSEIVSAVDVESAWAALLAARWTHYFPARNPRGYAICPTCTATPHSVDADAAMAARRSRKKK